MPFSVQLDPDLANIAKPPEHHPLDMSGVMKLQAPYIYSLHGEKAPEPQLVPKDPARPYDQVKDAPGYEPPDPDKVGPEAIKDAPYIPRESTGDANALEGAMNTWRAGNQLAPVIPMAPAVTGVPFGPGHAYGPVGGRQMVQNIGDASRMEQEGIAEHARATAKESEEIANTVAQNRKMLEAEYARNAAFRQAGINEAKRRVQELNEQADRIASTKLDQGRSFRNPAGILGAIGASFMPYFTGNPMSGVELINNQITRDLELQKQELGNNNSAIAMKRGLLGDFIALTHDEEQGRMLAEAKMKELAGMKLVEVANRYKSPQVMAEAKARQAALIQSANALIMQANHQAWERFRSATPLEKKAYGPDYFGPPVEYDPTKPERDAKQLEAWATGQLASKPQVPEVDTTTRLQNERVAYPPGVIDADAEPSVIGGQTGPNLMPQVGPLMGQRPPSGAAQALPTPGNGATAVPGTKAPVAPTAGQPVQTAAQNQPQTGSEAKLAKVSPTLAAILNMNPVSKNNVPGLTTFMREARAEEAYRAYSFAINSGKTPDQANRAALVALDTLKEKAASGTGEIAKAAKPVAVNMAMLSDIQANVSRLKAVLGPKYQDFMNLVSGYGIEKIATLQGKKHEIWESIGLTSPKDQASMRDAIKLIQAIQYANLQFRHEMSGAAVSESEKAQLERFLSPQMSAASLDNAVSLLSRATQAALVNSIQQAGGHAYPILMFLANNNRSYGPVATPSFGEDRVEKARYLERKGWKRVEVD